MGIIAWLLGSLFAIVMLLRYSKTAQSSAFQVLYFLYANTPVGQIFHNYLLSKSRENRTDNESRWFDYKNIPLETVGGDLQLFVVPFLSDNFCFVLMHETLNGKRAVVVDPADAQLVDEFLRHHSAKLTHILTTHKHADHAGGNAELKQIYADVEIIGGVNENVSSATKTVRDAETFTIQFSETCSISVTCCETPCHTRGHMCFIVQRDQLKPVLLFTGDHIFVGGCGRFFEGSAQNMFASMQKFKQRVHTMFPDYSESTKDDIVVLCGHEYALNTLQFASFLEPNNDTIYSKYLWALTRRNLLLPTVPSPWHDELQCNPYLRTDTNELKALFSTNDPIEIMGMLGDGRALQVAQQQQHS